MFSQGMIDGGVTVGGGGLRGGDVKGGGVKGREEVYMPHLVVMIGHLFFNHVSDYPIKGIQIDQTL